MIVHVYLFIGSDVSYVIAVCSHVVGTLFVYYGIATIPYTLLSYSSTHGQLTDALQYMYG